MHLNSIISWWLVPLQLLLFEVRYLSYLEERISTLIEIVFTRILV